MTRTSSTPNITPSSSSSSQPTPATTASSSASSSSFSSSYRLLSFVNDLRNRSEQATKKQQEAAAANESLAVSLQNEKKEARRLAKEIESTVKITRDARKQVDQLHDRMLEVEVRQAQGALLSSAAQLLELETAKALDVIKQETAAALAKYEQAGKQEAARSVALTRRFEEEAKQLAMTEANLEAARQSRAASDRRLESLAQERDKAAGELNEARDEVAQLRAEGEEIERAKADELEAIAELSACCVAMRRANGNGNGNGDGADV